MNAGTPQEIVEDARVFGKYQLVYCAYHLRPHSTGWCDVPVLDKVGLGLDNNRISEAYSKCRQLGLKLKQIV